MRSAGHTYIDIYTHTYIYIYITPTRRGLIRPKYKAEERYKILLCIAGADKPVYKIGARAVMSDLRLPGFAKPRYNGDIDSIDAGQYATSTFYSQSPRRNLSSRFHAFAFKRRKEKLSANPERPCQILNSHVDFNHVGWSITGIKRDKRLAGKIYIAGFTFKNLI